MTHRRRPWGIYALVAVLALPVLIALRHVPGPVWVTASAVLSALAHAYLWTSAHVWDILGAAALAVVARLAWGGYKLARMPAAARTHYLAAVWARARWRWLARNLGLAYEDKHQHSIRPVPFGTAAPMPAAKPARAKLRFPKARFTPTPHGFDADVRTVPKAGRAEFEEHAQTLADTWKCVRVSVSQPAGGKLLVRAFRTDPLLEVLGLADMPAPAGHPYQVWLGRDEHGADRWLDLRNVSGVCVGGQPGGGKSQGITSWEVQLAGKPWVQLANIDGKGASEFDDLDPRAWLTGDDSMDGMLAALEDLTGLMRDRLRTVRQYTGGAKNIWTVGPSAEWPVQFSVFDETQSFFDMAIAKAMGKDREKDCARAIQMGSELVRKGRSVGMVNVFSTQKPTTDSLPSAISSNCALNIAYSLKTLDAAKATLGADIGNYPTLNPVGLFLPDYAGVCVVSLRDGMLPFSKVRAPLVTEEETLAVSAASAHLRRDPRVLVPVEVPDDARELEVSS